MSKPFFGHPGILRVLFFTELWERFSYYGMRAILVLFMVAAPAKGGLGLDEKNAAAIYGLYTMFVYMLALPGGWLADNFLGLKRSVFLGGCIIALGHLIMVFPNEFSFYTGLICIVLGTGLLKPNISCMVGSLYAHHEQSKRDAAFSIFYIGINLGGFVAPFIVGYFGERINWHLGFAVSGIGMMIGLIYFRSKWKELDGVSFANPNSTPSFQRKVKRSLYLFLAALVLLFALVSLDIVRLDPVIISRSGSFLLGLFVILYFAFILIGRNLDASEKKNVWIIILLFCFSTVFYMGYEQQGSSMNLFADRFTERVVSNFEIPASWFQSLPSFYVFTLAPVFAWLWVWLASRGKELSIPNKFALGLFFTAGGFLAMVGASYIFSLGEKASFWWLVLTYGLHTVGEICLYPVGLSSVSLLSPKGLGGQMMGVWFMSLALGNLLAGIYAGNFEAGAIQANPMLQVILFGILAVILLIACVSLIFFKGVFNFSKSHSET